MKRPQHGRAPRVGATGFTLIEMLVVLAIAAMMAALCVPLLRRNDRLALDGAAQAMAGAMRLTRARAIESDETLDFLIDVRHAAYGSAAVPQKTLPRGVAVTMTFSRSLRRGRSIGGFRFFPNGESSGGEVALRLHGRLARIRVGWLDGEALVQ